MKVRSTIRGLALPLVLAMLGGLPALGQTSAPAPDRAEPLPPELEGVGIDEHLAAQLPLDLEFVDQTGKKVQLRDYFDGERPVILTLNYYRCPMLCGLMLNGVLDALRQLDWTAGQQFRVVTVSFDPFETHQLAAIKRKNYLTAYERPAGNWDFLTGRKPAIDALLEATGFRIRYNEQRQEWMHLAAPIICTPDGHISRYLYGVMFEPQTLRLSLVEASEGKIGTTVDRILLYCYHYEGGQYTLAVMNIVRGAGGLTFVLLAAFLAVLWRRERRRPKGAPA